MSLTLLALDLGTTTGFVCGTPEHHVSGVWTLKPSRFESSGMRYVKFRTKLNEIKAGYAVEHVSFEEVRRHLGVDAAHTYGGLMATLQAWCEENSITYEGVPVGTIKKFATGKGNADKEMMKAAARSWGYEVDDDNEADALAIFRLKMTEIGATLVKSAA